MTQLAFRALADPTRRDILVMLRDQELSIGELADNFDITRAAVAKHLGFLADGDLIITRTVGRTRINTINPEGFAPVNDWMAFFDTFWDEKLDALKNAIEKDVKQ